MRKLIMSLLLMSLVVLIEVQGVCFAAVRVRRIDPQREAARLEKERLRQQRNEQRRLEVEQRKQRYAAQQEAMRQQRAYEAQQRENARQERLRQEQAEYEREEQERRRQADEIARKKDAEIIARQQKEWEENIKGAEQIRNPSPDFLKPKWRNEATAGVMAQWGHILCLKTFAWAGEIGNVICPSWGSVLRHFVGFLALLGIMSLGTFLVAFLPVMTYKVPGKRKVCILSGLPGLAAVISSEIILSPQATQILHVGSLVCVIVSVIVAVRLATRHLEPSRRFWGAVMHVYFALVMVPISALLAAIGVQLLIVTILLLVLYVIMLFSGRTVVAAEKASIQRQKEEEFSDTRVANDGTMVTRYGAGTWTSSDGTRYVGSGSNIYKDFGQD